MRLGLFKQNLDIVNAHNDKKDSSFTYGINQFTDSTDEEYAGYNKLRAPLKKELGLNNLEEADDYLCSSQNCWS